MQPVSIDKLTHMKAIFLISFCLCNSLSGSVAKAFAGVEIAAHAQDTLKVVDVMQLLCAS